MDLADYYTATRPGIIDTIREAEILTPKVRPDELCKIT